MHNADDGGARGVGCSAGVPTPKGLRAENVSGQNSDRLWRLWHVRPRQVEFAHARIAG